MSKKRSARSRSRVRHEARRDARENAEGSTPGQANPPGLSQPAPKRLGWLRWPRGLRSPSQRERDTTLALIIAFAVVGTVIVTQGVGAPQRPTPTLVAVGGRVIPADAPDPSAADAPPASHEPRTSATPQSRPSATPSQPEFSVTPVAAPSPPPVVAEPVPEPPAVPPVAAGPPPPEPPGTTLVAAQPTDAVAAFYQEVAAGQFDAAYALWSERMRVAYPRAANLDERFADTAAITFDALYVAEETTRSAVVQANFTETYDSGSSRQFIGYWRLALTDGGWLLDEPHY